MVAIADTNNRPPGGASWALVGIPVLNWLAALTLAARSRIEYGSWPSYGSPDPTVFGLHHDSTIVMYVLSLAVALTGLFALGVGRICGKPAVDDGHVIIGLALVVSYIVFMAFDVGELSTWLGD